MNNEKEFKVGDKVTIFGGYGRAPVRVSEVTRVLKTQIIVRGEMRKFRLDGYQLGGPGYCHWWIKHWTEEHSAIMRRRKAQDCVESFKGWKSLSDEELYAVAVIVRAASERIEAKQMEAQYAE